MVHGLHNSGALPNPLVNHFVLLQGDLPQEVTSIGAFYPETTPQALHGADIWPLNLGNPRLGGRGGVETGHQSWILKMRGCPHPPRQTKIEGGGGGGRPKMPILDFQGLSGQRSAT